MANDDDDIVGFSPSDASRLLTLIESGEVPVRQHWPQPSAATTITVQVQNNTGWGTLAKYDPISLGNPLTTITATSSVSDIVFDGVAVDGKRPIAILQAQAASGDTVAAVVYGQTIAHIYVPSNAYYHWRFAEIIPSEGALRPSPCGGIRILSELATSGDVYALVSVGQHRGNAIILSPGGGIPAQSGSVMGYADCGIYGPKYSDGDLSFSVWAERVFNLSTTAVPAGVLRLATRVNDCLCVDQTPF